MSTNKSRGAGESAPDVPDFVPVKLRHRHDGLTAERQVAVVQALAESGCVREACARVGVSAEAVYRLRRRPDAQSFRMAMDIALTGAADRIEDGVFARAIHGVEIPHYYKGELVGTHRRYDERLALFLLRYRKPAHYGRHLDRRDDAPQSERAALGLADALAWVDEDARLEAAGLRRIVASAIDLDEGECWDETNLYRWAPAANAPLAPAEAEVVEADEDAPTRREGPAPPAGQQLRQHRRANSAPAPAARRANGA